MSRFIYIADTHMGSDQTGYHQQPRHPEMLPDILAALRGFIRMDGNIDFVLHGGDMTDAATDGNIHAAVAAFQLPVAVHLCLGNHDLTTTDALDRWLAIAPDFFGGKGRAEYSIATDDCVIHVVPNHWDEQPYFWDDAQDPHFSDEQIACLNEALGAHSKLPHVILTHCPARGLPAEQTGFADPFHAPSESFSACLSTLIAEHKNVCAVLGAHNHMNMRIPQDGVELVTASSLIETPFEFKLLDVSQDLISMTTISLRDSLTVNDDYDPDKAFVQGRAVDREFAHRFDRNWTGPPL